MLDIMSMSRKKKCMPGSVTAGITVYVFDMEFNKETKSLDSENRSSSIFESKLGRKHTYRAQKEHSFPGWHITFH